MFLQISIVVTLWAFCQADAKTIQIDRIIGGNEVSITNFPWQVSLVSEKGHFCGGSIIDDRHIVTAWHCFYNRSTDARLLRVRAGSTSRFNGGTLILLKKIILNEADDDIALIVLQNPLKFSERVQAIELPKPFEQIGVNTTVWISGWGTRQNGIQDRPEMLHATTVQIIEQEICNHAYANEADPNPVRPSEVCAGILNVGGRDTCSGDSGGPLALFENGSRVLHGITSWGQKCGSATHPGVYARVSHLVNWINQNKEPTN